MWVTVLTLLILLAGLVYALRLERTDPGRGVFWMVLGVSARAGRAGLHCAARAMTTSVFCACGAQWHGLWVARAAAHIAAHRARAQDGRGGCWMLTHAEYRQRFLCKCESCDGERRRERRLHWLKAKGV